MIKIERASNGWILSIDREYDEGGKYVDKMVFSYGGDEYGSDEDRKEVLEKLVEMFWTINEEVGVLYSKHQKHNIQIKVESNDQTIA